LRIALISLGDSAAEVRLAGHSIAWHQLQSALALGCGRVICLADAPGPALAALQRQTERQGASFHAVAHHRALLGLVAAADTLVVFAPGVLPDPEWLAKTIGTRAGIAVLRAEDAVEFGFERIDRDRAWAGVLATHGDAVEALAALPPDADAIAGLLRVALQRGSPAVAVPDGWLDDERWALLHTPAASHRYERAWYARHVPPPAPTQLGRALAYRWARALIERGDNARRSAPWLVAGGVLVALGSAVAGYAGHTFPALAGLTLASLAMGTGAAAARLLRAGSGEKPRPWQADARRALVDLSLAAVGAGTEALTQWNSAYVALVLVAMVRLADDPEAPAIVRPLADRTLVLILMALISAVGWFVQGAAVISLLGLAILIFWPRGRG
jgi:hypothetical protein